MFRLKHPGGLHLTRLLLQKPKSYSIVPVNHLKFASARPSSLMVPSPRFRLFSSQQQEAQEPLDELELEALAIQKGIDQAREKIEANIQEGLGLSRRISEQVEEDKFEKMQRYDIFISKMEQLKRAEKRWARQEKKALHQMQSAYMNSGKPLKDLLHYYNKAAVKGFESSLVMNTLHQILMTLRARGNEPRPFEDYSTRELDGSWRMQMLASHLSTALRKDLHFNHYHMGQTSRLLGEIGFKDVEVIQAYFERLNRLLDERETGYEKPRRELNFEEVVYGGFLNFLPRHYVFEGFDSNEEFRQHLTTLLEWQVKGNEGLQNLGVEPSEEVIDLEQSMANLIAAASTVNDLNVNVQASIDSLRQQYFKIQEANDKYEWMKENKFIRLELLELQEMLVKAGYILPEEAEKFSSSQPQEVRMERAARIFYEYVQACVPEFMSPQYTDIIKAAHESVDARQQPKEIVPLDEEHDKLSLSSLSQSLIGLASQALSYRRESNGHDYLHKYYEDLALEKERLLESAGGQRLEGLAHLFEEANVSMAREYLKAYKIFEEEVQKMEPRMLKLIEQSSSDAEGLLHGLLALSACKIEAPRHRLMIFENFKKLTSQGTPPNIRPQALIDGLRGVALQYQQTAESAWVAKFCLEKLEKDLGPLPEQSLTFDQRLDILWSACALGLEKESTLIKDLYQGLQLMHFQRTSNDLTFQQFQKVRDFQLYLTEISAIKDEPWIKQHINPVLQLLAKNPRLHEDRYAEKTAKFDPFKKRVLLGLARGLTMASIDHQLSLEENLVSQTDAEVAAYEELYPYQPDIIIGHNGQKVLLDVITASQTMRDVGKPDGSQVFRYKILKGLHAGKQDFKVVAVPVTSVVNYDIENRKIEMKEDYNFVEDFDQQIKNQGGATANPIQLGSLPKFGANITGEASTYLASLLNLGDKQRLDGFLKQLYKLFQIKHHAEKQYEPAMFQQGLDQLKFELMKLSLMFEALPEHQKAHIQKLVPSDSKGTQTFQDMIKDARDKTNWTVSSGESLDDHKIEGIDLHWMGTRQEVELPQSKELEFKKNLMPEMINQRFMWVDDYFHYKDWEHAQKEVFDSFNLLSVPRKEGEYKYFYDRGMNQRIVPQGIFPSPNGKRHLLKPSINKYAGELEEFRERGNNSVTLFEKDPMKFMVLKEEARSSQMKDLTPDVSLITNLQNLKQGLKSDYSDKQIVDLILGNSHFTEQLIAEHLGKGPREKGRQDSIFLPRDPRHYRAFVHATYESKDQEDPFTHFFIKEAGKVERIHKVHNDAEERYAKLINDNPDPESRKRAEELRKTLEDKVIDMLLENRLENEDTIGLSHQVESEVKIEYHLKSLMRSEFIHDVDPDLVNEDISDAAFLALQRKRAETKLIKAKIIYKQHEGLELSANEMRYLRAWTKEIQTNEKINVLNVRDSMLQQSRSALTMDEALSAEDLYALNQVTGVELKKGEHGQYALSDLVLEMAHFIDDDFVNRIEMQMISNRIKNQWKLANDFSVVETRNKEISLVINELEELAWRMAGAFDQREIDTIKTMFNVMRNRDHFDKQFYDSDMKSMDEFMEKTNRYDDRAKLLEEWVVRKEEEWKSRAALPPKHLQKSDFELNEIIDSKLKKARESLVAKLLEREEAQGSTKKEYLDLTTADLSKITEQLVIRLGLFNGEYPAFVPQLVRAVMEHPNLSRVEYSKISTFCQMFELDWRGDQALANKKEFLATNPVYVTEADRSNFEGYGSVGNFEVTAMLRQACVPYVAELTDQLLKKAAQRGTSPKEQSNE